MGPANRIDHASVVRCDDLSTVHRSAVGRIVGYLLDDQEEALAEAVIAAFDLEV